MLLDVDPNDEMSPDLVSKVASARKSVGSDYFERAAPWPNVQGRDFLKDLLIIVEKLNIGVGTALGLPCGQRLVVEVTTRDLLAESLVCARENDKRVPQVVYGASHSIVRFRSDRAHDQKPLQFHAVPAGEFVVHPMISSITLHDIAEIEA